MVLQDLVTSSVDSRLEVLRQEATGGSFREAGLRAARGVRKSLATRALCSSASVSIVDIIALM